MRIRFLAPLVFALVAVSCTQPGILQDLSKDWTASAVQRSLKVDFPGTFRLPGDRFTLTRTFLADSVAGAPDVWLSLGNLDFPCEVRFNGDLVYTRGTLPPGNSWVQSSTPAVFRLPSSLWKPFGQPNTVVIDLYAPGPEVRLPSRALLGDRSFVDFQFNVVQLLNGHFFFLFAGINLVGGLYFLTVWTGRREDWSRFYFALSTLFMGLYFLEQGCPVALFPGPAYKAFMKACLFFSMGFIMAFFLEFFSIHNKAWLRASFLTVFGVSGLFVATSPDTATTMDRFTVALFPMEASILFVLYLLARALKDRHPEAGHIFVGTLLAVGFGTHDVVYQMQGVLPIVWLQGAGFFALQGSMFLSLALQSTRLYRTLEETTKAFARFVPKEFLAFLGKPSIHEVVLGDQVQKNMAILFSDIRDFTALSERLSPNQNFNLINAYLNRMAPEVRRHGGIIDSYIGDAIMALYAAGSAGALRSALAMRTRLIEYNTGRTRAGYAPLEMGIGIHTGSLMLGTIGDEHRMDTTVISDAVNTASRLEGLTKVFHVSIIISQNVLDEAASVRSEITVRYLGKIPVRGRSQGLELYELIHPQDPWFDAKVYLTPMFEDAVREWEEGEGGLGKFKAYRNRFPEDPVLEYFLG